MGLFTSSRTRDAEDEPADGTDDESPADTDGSGGRRRWLLLGLVIVAGVALYALSRRRASREAEFTEIELDPVDGDSETESEPTSTE
jgi:hypothetical protein